MINKNILCYLTFTFLVSPLRGRLHGFWGAWQRCNSLEWGAPERRTRGPVQRGSGSAGDVATAFMAPASRCGVAPSYGRHCSLPARSHHSASLRLALHPKNHTLHPVQLPDLGLFQFTLKSPRPPQAQKGRQPKTISCHSSSRASRFTLSYSPASSVCAAILFLHAHGYQYPLVPGAPEPEDAPDPMPEVPPVAPEPGAPEAPPAEPLLPGVADPGVAPPDRRGGRFPCSGRGAKLPWPVIPGCLIAPGCPGITPVPPACPAGPLLPGVADPGLALPDRRGGRFPCSGWDVVMPPWPAIPGCLIAPGCPGIPPVPPACPAEPDPGTLEAPPVEPFIPGVADPGVALPGGMRGGRFPCSVWGVIMLP